MPVTETYIINVLHVATFSVPDTFEWMLDEGVMVILVSLIVLRVAREMFT